MNRYNLKPLPRDSDGNIDINEYRETIWFSQLQQEQDIQRMNGIQKEQGKEIVILKREHTLVKGFFLITGVIASVTKALKWW